ncbi:hybrid signal transduction histidine kinase dhkK [Acrasis kona]|uniref:histidine kinase n=1 Tax=Acrasis kona TaxID=1008807 RepID=A0AAW2ZK26_9EUKA
MPVIRKNELIAVLYLENTLTEHCFKSEQVQLLNILTAQISISMENAFYFKSKMKAVRELAETEANRTKDQIYHKKQEEFVDRICHEIRNPIQGLLGCCEVLKHVNKKLTTHNIPVVNDELDTLHSCIESIQACGTYQKVITDDVLTLSKLEMGKVSLIIKPMSPLIMIQHIERMFMNDAAKKNIYLRVSVSDAVKNIVIDADYNRISQVVINMVSNAIKFTSKGGVDVGCDLVGNELIFLVSDTGMGVDALDQSAIFDRFVQASQRNMSEYSGSGLGLFICKMLADLMNGHIWVESGTKERSVGSQFKFRMPCLLSSPKDAEIFTKSLKREVSQASSTEEPENFENINILVVEDNSINRRVLGKMLDTIKCPNKSACDGLEGFNVFKSNNFDLIFMDISMPIMNGLECTRKIREYEQSNNLNRVTIIGLSGNARQEHQDEGIKAGMDDYCTKPIQKVDMIRVIGKVAENKAKAV